MKEETVDKKKESLRNQAKEIYCTYCGTKCEYMGIRTVLVGKARQKIYDRYTGKPLREQYWECPKFRKLWGGWQHSQYTKPSREPE